MDDDKKTTNASDEAVPAEVKDIVEICNYIKREIPVSPESTGLREIALRAALKIRFRHHLGLLSGL
jgi:hypothetical protein